jgi:hypothetical protein
VKGKLANHTKMHTAYTKTAEILGLNRHIRQNLKKAHFQGTFSQFPGFIMSGFYFGLVWLV